MTLVWQPGFQFDADASTYIEAVEAADTQALETGVRYAINDFVIGCKNDGIWDAIKACCILAGARTLNGALVPLVGTAPTKNGTEGGWNYNRETGLQGNGTDNYLDTNRANNADPQDNNHNSAYVASIVTQSTTLLGCEGLNDVLGGGCRNRSGVFAATNNNSGFKGASRDSASFFSLRSAGTGFIAAGTTSGPVTSATLYAFARNNPPGTASQYASARIAFYSIGESLDLAKLDARVTDLITAIGAAIP